MPVIERDDGVQFAVFTYRELMMAKKTSLLRQEVNILQSENGDYARFFEQDTGDIEAVFSKEPGYLLAECVWSHLKQPSDLIFCEQLPDGENAILIVVRSGSVFLDAKVPITSLVDDFISLATSENKYDIYTSGEVPLAQIPSDETYAFPPELVKSFKQLDKPIFPKLSTVETFSLLPVGEAFKELSVAQSNLSRMLIYLVILFGVGYGLYQMFKPAPVKQAVVTKPVYVDPYAAYKKALTSPSPAEVIFALTKKIRKLTTIPGWDVNSITLQGEQILVQLKSNDGTADILIAWVRNNEVTMQVNGDSASISTNISLKDRVPPAKIYNIRDSVANVFDRLRLLSSSKNISVGASTDNKSYVMTDLTLNVTGMTPDILNLVGKDMQGLPVVIGDISLTMNNGLLSGSVELSVLGDREK